MTGFIGHALTTIAFCWRLDRADGVAMGFTSHDRDLAIDGIVYRAAPGMLPSAISVSDGLEVDTLDVSGALSDAAITGTDLAIGRWDGARVRLFATDWTAPGAERLLLARGTLGDVSEADDAFTAELRGPTAMLERPAVEQTSPDCRAELGDRRCRVDLAGRTRIATVAAVEDAVLTIAGGGLAAGAFAYGRLRWLDGGNAGIAAAVLASDADSVTLREAPMMPVAAGTRVELREGCDKRFETCVARFANALNFRGEPHLPGNDLLLRYPGAA